MNKVTVLLIAAFVLAFLAGGAVGVFFAAPEPAGAEKPTTRPAPRRGPPRGLTEELKLTAEQQEKMRKIWSSVMSRSPGASREQWDKIRGQRDEKIQAMLTDEQRTQYAQLQAEYEQAREALHRQRLEVVEQAVEATKKILTPEQAKKYEEIRKRGRFGRGGSDPSRRSHWSRRGPDSRPDSHPGKPPRGPGGGPAPAGP